MSGRNHKTDRRRRSGGEMTQSPVHSYKEADPPTTPCRGSPQQKAIFGSPTPETLCPQPRRAFPDVAASFEQFAILPAGTEEAACSKELKDLWSSSGWKTACAATPGRLPWENRPLSSVSTSAGATPSLDEQYSRVQFSPAPSSAAPTPALQDDRYMTVPAVPPSQVRKIFVGGIPQDTTQDDLCDFFNRYGTVTKAWLQRHRASDNGFGQAPAQRAQSHRGFGFVIFHDSTMVDDLLGAETSVYLEIKEGRKVEVKRAKSSNDITMERQAPQDAPKQFWNNYNTCKQPVRDQPVHPQPQQCAPQPLRQAPVPHFVPQVACATMNCNNMQGGGWPCSQPVANQAQMPVTSNTMTPAPTWGMNRSVMAPDNAQGSCTRPAQALAQPTPQMMFAQMPPFPLPWAGGVQSEEDKQKLVKLLQASAPAYYDD